MVSAERIGRGTPVNTSDAGGRRTLHVIIPVLNEAPNMPRLMGDLTVAVTEFEEHVRILLVDDGSTDGTVDAARAAGTGLDLTVLRHDANQGPGRAFATAFSQLASDLAPEDWVVTMEGDNTSRVALLHQMRRRAEEGFDVVLASPYLYGGGIINTQWHRAFISHVANVFVKEVLGIRGIMTISSFFRLYRGSIVLRLQRIFGEGIMEVSGFEAMVENLMKLVMVGASISEVAMTLDTSVRIGRSKMPVIRTALGYLRLAGKRRLWTSRIEGNPVGDRI